MPIQDGPDVSPHSTRRLERTPPEQPCHNGQPCEGLAIPHRQRPYRIEGTACHLPIPLQLPRSATPGAAIVNHGAQRVDNLANGTLYSYAILNVSHPRWSDWGHLPL